MLLRKDLFTQQQGFKQTNSSRWALLVGIYLFIDTRIRQVKSAVDGFGSL